MDVTINIPSVTINLISAEAQAGLAAIPIILRNQEKSMATDQQTLDQLAAIKQAQTDTNTALDKVSAESTGLVTLTRDQAALIEDLKTQLANAPVSQEIKDMVAEIAANASALKDKATSIDNQVDDVAPNPTETPPETPTETPPETPPAGEVGAVGEDGNPVP